MNPVALDRQDSGKVALLYMALELSKSKWKVGFEYGRKRRTVTVEGGAVGRLKEAIEEAKAKFGLQGEVVVVSCYEAGRDGFWLHRLLTSWGIENLVVDPASIEVSRQAKRTKTDRVDLEMLLSKLRQHHRGERVWKVVRVPDEEAEAGRHLHREAERLKGERSRYINRIKGLLFLQGIRLERLDRKDGKGREPAEVRWSAAGGGPARGAQTFRRTVGLGRTTTQSHRRRTGSAREGGDGKGGDGGAVGDGSAVAPTQRDRPGCGLGICHGILWLAAISPWQRSRRPGGPDGDALRQWRDPPRAGDQQGGQPTGARTVRSAGGSPSASAGPASGTGGWASWRWPASSWSRCGDTWRAGNCRKGRRSSRRFKGGSWRLEGWLEG